MLATALASLAIGYAFGFYIRDLWDKIHSLETKVKTTVKRQPEPPKSSLLEPPLTPAERIQRDQEELLERLNPR